MNHPSGKWQVSNTLGQPMLLGQWTMGNTLELDLGTLPTGFYIITLHSEDGVTGIPIQKI
jgi:hypothetical protein